MQPIDFQFLTLFVRVHRSFSDCFVWFATIAAAVCQFHNRMLWNGEVLLQLGCCSVSSLIVRSCSSGTADLRGYTVVTHGDVHWTFSVGVSKQWAMAVHEIIRQSLFKFPIKSLFSFPKLISNGFQSDFRIVNYPSLKFTKRTCIQTPWLFKASVLGSSIFLRSLHEKPLTVLQQLKERNSSLSAIFGWFLWKSFLL